MSFTFDTPKSAGGGGWPSKDDLEGRTIVVRLRSFDPKHDGSYGETALATVDLTVLDGADDWAGTQFPGYRFYGAPGKVCGDQLQIDQVAPAKFLRIDGKKHSYLAPVWVTDEAEKKAAAEAYLKIAQTPPF